MFQGAQWEMLVDCEGHYGRCSGLGDTPRSSMVVEHSLALTLSFSLTHVFLVSQRSAPP